MYLIENALLKVEINPHGGCLKNVYDKRKSKELLYQPDGTSWSGQDVVIFPVIAALKNHSYKVDGKSYSLKNHGLIRYNDVYLVNKFKNEIILGFDDSEETLKYYPYKFHFEISYKLLGNKIIISYSVTNNDTRSIYFSLGGHPALVTSLTNNEFDDVSIFINGLIEKRYDLNEEGSQIVGTTKENLSGFKNITKKEIESKHTLIYDAKKVDSIKLKINNNEFIFDVSNAPILAIWSMEKTGNFICVEPWWGLPDYDAPMEEISQKEKIIELAPKKIFKTDYSITVLK